MLKIAICDDKVDQLEHINLSVKQYFSLHLEFKIQIELFSNSLLFLDHLDKVGCYDVVLLDICMPGILGTEVAKEIRGRHDRTEIIFLTTSDEYAIDAFALKAAHYLLKPFTQEQFDEAMERAMSGFLNGMPKSIVIRSESGELHNVNIKDVLYIESQNHNLRVYTKNVTILESRRSITRMLEELEALSPRQFISPYKGYIVNQKAILTIERENIILRNEAKIPIPKRGYRDIQNQYLDYIFNENNHKSGVVE